MQNLQRFIRKCVELPGSDQEKLLQNFQWVNSFFVSEFARGATHFSRISGRDVTSFFLEILWVKLTSLKIPEWVFQNTRPHSSYCPNSVWFSGFFSWNSRTQSFSYSFPQHLEGQGSFRPPHILKNRKMSLLMFFVARYLEKHL